MPITGIVSSEATRAANSAGIFSNTKAKQPISSSKWASSISLLASASSRARTVYVPNLLIDCGVNPKCPIIGIPAHKIRSIDSRTSAPPSNLIQSACVSFITRIAEAKASLEFPWYVPKGRSTTTSARFTAFMTDLPW